MANDAVFEELWSSLIEAAEVEPSPEEEGFARWGWNMASGDYANGYIDGKQAGYYTCGSCEHAWEAHDGECGAYMPDGSICGCKCVLTTQDILDSQQSKLEEMEKENFELRHTLETQGNGLMKTIVELSDSEDKVAELENHLDRWMVARPIAEYHEDLGCALWYEYPISEPPYVGTPNDCDWPGYHTHFVRLTNEMIPVPSAPEPPREEKA